MRFLRTGSTVATALCLVLLGQLAFWPAASHAATAQQIDDSASQTLALFKSQVPGATSILRDAKGILIFPQVIQAGIGIGGEYGEGVLRVGGRNVRITASPRARGDSSSAPRARRS